MGTSITPRRVHATAVKAAYRAITRRLPKSPNYSLVREVVRNLRGTFSKEGTIGEEHLSGCAHQIARRIRMAEIPVSREAIEESLKETGAVKSITLTEKELRELAALRDNLLIARSVEEVSKIASAEFVRAGIPGVGVYLRDPATGKILNTERVDLEGYTRFGVFKMPDGEKKQQADAIDAVNEIFKRAETDDKKMVYKKLMDQLSDWNVTNREEGWLEWGINVGTVADLRERMDREGIEDLVTNIGGSYTLATELVKEMVSMAKEKLCLSASCMTIDGGSAFGEFLKKNSISSEEEIRRLKNVHELTMAAILKIATKVTEDAFPQIEKAAEEHAREKGLICPMLNVDFLRFTARNFVKALNDLEKDVGDLLEIVPDDVKKQYASKEELIKFLRKCADKNFNHVVRDSEGRIIAVAIGNRHKRNAMTGKIEPLFPSAEAEKMLSERLRAIDNSLAQALIDHRNNEQMAMTDKEQKGLLELSQNLNDAENFLINRYVEAARKIAAICQKNGLPVGCTIQIKSKRGTLVIVASANKPEDYVGMENDIGEGISGYVIKTGEALFVDVETLSAKPEIFGLLRKGDSEEKENTFISVPIGDLGVLNVDGMKITRDLETFVKSAAQELYQATKNSAQAEELARTNEQLTLAVKQLADRNEQLRLSEITDQITRILNRRYLDSELQDAFEEAKKAGTPLAFLMIDMDGLKPYDDKDHLAGDHILRCIARFMKEFRDMKAKENPKFEAAKLARYGGDEFSLVLPGLTTAEANKYAEELRQYVASQPVVFEMGEFSGSHKFTISIGVAGYLPTMQFHTNLIKNADEALYWSKRKGKNRVCVYTSDVANEILKIKTEEELKSVQRSEAEQRLWELVNAADNETDRDKQYEILKQALIQIKKLLLALKK